MVAGVVTTLAEGVPDPSDAAPMMMVVSSGLVAFFASVICWPIFAYLLTIPHEGGHAIVASMLGGRIASIKMDRLGNGVTAVQSLGWVGSFMTGLAGYTGPSIFGIIGAALLAENQLAVVLWVSIAMLALALLQARSVVMFTLTLLLGGVFFLVVRYAAAGEQRFFAYTWVWFLLLGGFRGVIHLQILRRDNSNVGDVGILRSMTHLPGSLWAGLFWLVSLVGLIYGACLMFGYMHIENLWHLIQAELF
jgi:hypothetical protein